MFPENLVLMFQNLASPSILNSEMNSIIYVNSFITDWKKNQAIHIVSHGNYHGILHNITW